MKYELTSESKVVDGHTLYRIRATKDFSSVKKCDLGGFIEKVENLSQEGDCWVSGNAQVYDNAWVSGNAQVYDNAWVYDNALVYDNAQVSGNAQVYDNAWVFGDARVYDNALVFGDALVYGNAQVYDNARVYDNAQVYGSAWVYNYAYVYGSAEVNEGANSENIDVIPKKIPKKKVIAPVIIPKTISAILWLEVNTE